MFPGGQIFPNWEPMDKGYLRVKNLKNILADDVGCSRLEEAKV